MSSILGLNGILTKEDMKLEAEGSKSGCRGKSKR